MLYKIFLIFIFCHLGTYAMNNDKWQHDYYHEDNKPKKICELARLNQQLSEILIDKSRFDHWDSIVAKDFKNWEYSFIKLHDRDRKPEDLTIIPSLLHNLYDFKKYFSDAGIKKIYFLTTQYLGFARKQGPLEIDNFAKALNALHHIGIKLGEQDFSRNDIVEFIEKNMSHTASDSSVRKIFSSCSLLHVSLSPKAEKLLIDYVKTHEFYSATIIGSFVEILAHYRLYVPNRILYRYFELPNFFISDDIYLLWSLAISALNKSVNEYEAEKFMDKLFEAIAKSDTSNMRNSYISMINFSISAYKVLYEKNPRFALTNKPENGSYQSEYWVDLISRLQKKYPNIILEKEIAIIGAAVDAYLELYGQRFIIQFDGPSHFLLENNSREDIIKFNGATKAQTKLLLCNNFVVIRVDYLENEDGISFQIIKDQISRYKPKTYTKRRRSENPVQVSSKKAKYEFGS